MADLHPDDLKDQGNTALKEGRVSEAVSLYTKAIALDSRNAVYFGNRAVAYLQLDKASEALADADRAIDAQRTYTKGYAHKGTALEKMGRFEEAKAAYRAGLEVEEGNAMLTRKLKELQDRTSPRPAPAASASSAAGAGAPASGSSGTARADSPIVKFGRVGMLVLAIAYLLPYIGLGARAYTGVMLLSIIVHGALVMQEAGPFRFSAEVRAPIHSSFQPAAGAHCCGKLLIFTGDCGRSNMLLYASLRLLCLSPPTPHSRSSRRARCRATGRCPS